MINNSLYRYKSLPVQIKASLWFLVCSFLQQGVSVITSPIFTRILSTAEYGKYSVFYSWQNIVAIFVSLRLYYGVYSQGIVKFEEDKKIFSSSLQGLSITLCFIWLLLYLPCQTFWNRIFTLNTTQMLFMTILIWTTAVFNYWATEQRVEFKYRKLVIITIMVAILEPLLGIVFVLLAEDKVTARIFSLVIVEFFVYLPLFISQMKSGKKFYSKKYWIYALRFNIPLIPHYLSQTVLNSADRLMINSMIGSDEAGIYSLAYSISQVMLLFNTALLQTLTPWMYKKIKSRKEKDIAKIAYMSLVGIAFVNILLIIFAPEIVAIFAPRSYYGAIWIIPPVAMSVYFIFAYSLFANFEFYYEKTNLIMVASVFAAVLNIALNYIFLKKFGYYAAGYTTLFCYILYAGCHYIFMRNINKTCMDDIVIYEPKILLSISIAFFILGFLIMLLYKLIFVRYFLILILVFGCFVLRKKIINSIKIIISIKNND